MVKHIEENNMPVVLTCGEGGSTGSEVLSQINANPADVETIDARVATIEASHSLLLNCESLAVAQEPTIVDTPIQVEYGAAQSVTDVSMAADGALTFNTTAKYQININAHYGRSGAAGVSLLLFRLLMDNVAFGKPLAAKVESSNILVPWSSTFIIQATAGQVLTSELMRDSTGDNSGGIYNVDPAVIGWDAAACITMQIYRV